MYAATSPSDPASAPAADVLPLRRWSDGAAELAVRVADGETRVAHLYQSDPCRLLFPRRAHGACEAVVVTTSGGIVGGDRLRFDFAASPRSSLAVTTQAAEKVYRSARSEAEIDISLDVGADACLEWVPQETILFDAARLRRRTRVDLAPGARLIASEMVVFGRRARGERFSQGLLHDEWRIWQDGRLAWADAFHLSGDVESRFANDFALRGAAAYATLLHVGPDAEAMRDRIRGTRVRSEVDIAATVVDGLLVVRLLSPDATALRRGFLDAWMVLRGSMGNMGGEPPRVWSI